MYAVIETGGKQYRVEVGTQLEVELLDAHAGDTITLDRVLLIADGETTAIGRPLVADASVSAEVVRRERGTKVISFKYRPKARRRVKHGHRQELHVLRISDIVLDGKSAAEDVRRAESQRTTERERLEEAARRQAAEDAALAAKLAAAAASKAESGGSTKAAPPSKSKTAGEARPEAKAETARTTSTSAAPEKPQAQPKTPQAGKKSAAAGSTADAAPKTARKPTRGTQAADASHATSEPTGAEPKGAEPKGAAKPNAAKPNAAKPNATKPRATKKDE